MRQFNLVHILLLVFPCFILFLNTIDLYSIFIDKSEYPFQNEFIGPLSIYSSCHFFMAYTISSIIIGIASIVFYIRKQIKLFYASSIICLLFIIYPMLTAMM